MILTSYFGKRNIKKTGLTPVGISPTAPSSFHGKRYMSLAPSWDMLKLAYEGKKKEFSQRYVAEVLEWLDPLKVYAELDGSILLTHDDFLPVSHRRLVAEWLEKATGNEVGEFGA
ncbi:MAG: hypothetical protein IJM68_00885 [Synergistaceae bacterium]|nr:hypothetical protein [Synergistaceae bacterium]